MSLREDQRTVVEEHQREEGDESDPLLKETVRVHGNGRGGETPYVTPTRRGGEIVGLLPGEEATVEVFEDKIVIHASG